MTGSVATQDQRWLYGPLPDLLFGCGALYALTAIVFAIGGEQIRAHEPQFVIPLIVTLLSAPHYGATLLRVYEHRVDQRRYALFTVHATIVVVIAFVAGLFVPVVGSLMLTVYLIWSPWHYTGQNYGLAIIFLRRRGFALDAHVKRTLYATFILSYVITFLVMNEATGVATDIPVSYEDGTAITFRSLGIPLSITRVLVPAVGLVYVAALVAAADRAGLSLSAWAKQVLRRQLRARPSLPPGHHLCGRSCGYGERLLCSAAHRGGGLCPVSSTGTRPR